MKVYFLPNHQHPEDGDGISSRNFGKNSHPDTAVCPSMSLNSVAAKTSRLICYADCSIHGLGTMRIYDALMLFRGYAMAQLVEALRQKQVGRGFDSRWSHSNFPLK